MDAKITKQRLGNLLSYDWIKILVSIGVAVVALVLFFTMVGTRPTNAQTFTVFSHANLIKGKDFSTLHSSLENRNVFSYDILSIEAESFQGNEYAASAFSARRAAGMGTVYLVPDTPVFADGKLVENSTELTSQSGGIAYKGGDNAAYYDTVYYLEDCGNYLAGFYKNGEIDMDAVRACFLARNGGDKRFRSSAKEEEGILQERARIEALQEDYIAVQAAFESGKLSHIEYETEHGVYNFGISLSGLSDLRELVYFNREEGDDSFVRVALMIFYNGNKTDDLRFETVSFLNYLVEKYGG